MREILLTSSVLILAVLLLRLAFRDRISRRAQYALWGLVLLRLLVPVSLPGVDFSVLSAAEPVGQAVAERLEQRLVYAMPTEVYDYADPGQSGATEPSPAAGNFGVTDDSMDLVDRTWHSNLAPDGTVQSEYYSGGVIIEGDQYGGVVPGDQPTVLANAPANTDALRRGGVQVSCVPGGGRAPLPLPVRAPPTRHLPDARRRGLAGPAEARAGP